MLDWIVLKGDDSVFQYEKNNEATTIRVCNCLKFPLLDGDTVDG